MKLPIIPTALFVAAMTTGSANAMISKSDVSSAVRTATSNGHIFTRVEGNTVILSGRVEGVYDVNQAVRAAKRVAGVDRVISRIGTSN